ncbi:MAG: tetratricopeptide repeat protein [Planctomycetes bacterium]|nr:tetratricopeptide repeat protein [Planctomycetota bacterium]
MRASAGFIALVVTASAAFGRGMVGGSFGGGRPGGCGRGGSGLSLRFGHHTGHSSFSVSFVGGGCWYGSSYWFGGPGIYTYPGWAPYSVYGYTAAPPAAADSADALIDQGDDWFARGGFARAVVFYRAAAQKAPQNPTAALALGHGLFATGAYAEAAAELRRAVKLHPDILRVPMDRRDFYADPAAFDAQLQRLERAAAAAPADSAARFLLAYNLYFTGRRASAAEHFRALGDKDPEAQLFLRAQ